MRRFKIHTAYIQFTGAYPLKYIHSYYIGIQTHKHNIRSHYYDGIAQLCANIYILLYYQTFVKFKLHIKQILLKGIRTAKYIHTHTHTHTLVGSHSVWLRVIMQTTSRQNSSTVPKSKINWDAHNQLLEQQVQWIINGRQESRM